MWYSTANGDARLTFLTYYKIKKKKESIASWYNYAGFHSWFPVILTKRKGGWGGEKLKLLLRRIHKTHQIIKSALSPISLVSNFLLNLIEVRQPPVELLALFCRISVYSWCRQWLQAGLWITPHGEPCPPTAMTRSLQITWKNSSQLKCTTSDKMFLCRALEQRANSQVQESYFQIGLIYSKSHFFASTKSHAYTTLH